MPPTAVVMIGMPRRCRYPGSRTWDAWTSRKADNRSESFWTISTNQLGTPDLRDVSKRPQGRMGGDVLGIGPRTTTSDIVSHAFEDHKQHREPGPPAPSRS